MALATEGFVKENKLLMPANLTTTGYLHVNRFTFHNILVVLAILCLIFRHNQTFDEPKMLF